MRTSKLACFIFLFAFCSYTQAADVKTLKANDSNDPNGPYTVNMIKLALEHIDTKYNLDVGHENFTQARTNEEVGNGKLDIFWTSSSQDVESEFQPIRIPLFKGLLGCRIFIINKNNQAKFDQINTLEDLKKLKFGQGRTWGDTKVLEANGFNIVKVSKYENLFYMVDGERFDAFPRGVHEPFEEVAKHPNLNLAVEKGLMIIYRMPFYVFVSKNNQKLAKDLEDGFNKAIADGSFDKLFYSSPQIKDIIEKANMKNRKVFYLDNPTLSKETPLNRKELWVDPKDF